MGPAGDARRVSATLAFLCGVISVLAMADLGIRAALRLEMRWDTFAYHVPFDALRGGLAVPYDMSDTVRGFYEGFPPLPHLMQGMLWRLTGSLNATGAVNYLAFAAFILFCHIVLHARFWVVTLISLTAPLVLIHTTVSYVDLFGNSLLAIGTSSCLYLYLFSFRRSCVPLIGGLIGIVGAAWSKYQLVPVVALLFGLFLFVGLRWASRANFHSARLIGLLVMAAAVAAVPYAKNVAEYGNPIWPIALPIVGAALPSQLDATTLISERPPPLRDRSSPDLFINSLFEIDHPTHYDYRPRWIIDQGNAWIAFRMGGFWATGVVTYLALMIAMLFVFRRRVGIYAGGATIGVLSVVALLPQSHELRYYLFIPLTWAAAIGMLFPHLAKRFVVVGPAVLLVVLGLFFRMASENLPHYQISRVGYLEAAQEWGASRWWPLLQSGHTYCAVDMAPIGILLTGPTMTEFSIVDRSSERLCPTGSTIVTKGGIGAVKQ